MTVKEVCVSIRWVNHCFHVLKNIVIAVTVSLGRPYARSICSIFPLSMESNALEKSTKKSFTTIFFAQIPSIIQLIVRISCGSIYLKNLLIFPKNSLNFRFDTVEKQSIIYLRFIPLKFLVILRSPFFGKERMQPFVPLAVVFWFQNQSSHQICLSSILLGVFHWGLPLFCF